MSGACYLIRVAEPLEPRWSDWLAGLEISPAGPGATLCGQLPDQAALYGVLARLRDLNLTLLEVRRLDYEAEDMPEEGEK